MKISWSKVATDGGQEEARHDALAHFSEENEKIRKRRRDEGEEDAEAKTELLFSARCH